ncbi:MULTISPECIES: AAA family ATPase [unclassified Streptomyces]|uniref:ParA family protein n=1 Tax=unclassified Streptomyces TaxID=2593676 RepID=UPI0003A63D35|nr:MULTISPECIES: AAA family ATPase [unclassified Streptomyces]
MPMSAEALGIDYVKFSKVAAFASGKGGVGKTTLTGNNATKTASRGIPTLALDINGQGNLRREFGLDEGDKGERFYEAMRNGTPLVPVKNVRPNLDVVMGGEMVRQLNTLFLEIAQKDGPYAAFCRLAVCLQPLLEQYGVVWIDAPPENPNMLMLVLCACRWLVAPVKMDVCSLDDALKDISGAFAAAKQVNQFLELLGIVHFGSPNGSAEIHREVVREARKKLGKNTHVFDETIHASFKTAKLARSLGLSVWELADLKRPEDKRLAGTIEKLGEAHDKLTTAMLRRMQSRLEMAA